MTMTREERAKVLEERWRRGIIRFVRGYSYFRKGKKITVKPYIRKTPKKR